MANLSTIDDMPNITKNFTNEVYYHDETNYERILLEIFTIIGLMAVVSNSLIAFVILKFKKMREDATNIIFLHVNILEAIYFLAAPMTLRFAMLLAHTSALSATVFCVSYQIESSVIFIATWFFMLLVCDWYLKVYYPVKYTKFCNLQKFFIIILYVIFIFFGTITTQCCFQYYMSFISVLSMFAFLILFVVFLIIMNIVHLFRRKKLLSIPRKGAIGLAVTNITFFCWTPAVLFILISIFGIYLYSPISIIIIFAIGHLSPLLNFLYLYWYDDNYHIFLRQVFRCRCNDYQNEDLEDQSVSYNDSNGVKIPVN